MILRRGAADHAQPRMLTAFAMTSVNRTSEIIACAAINILAHRRIGITSVGLNAVAFVNARYR